MKFALDKEGNRIYIESTHIKVDYFCPQCGEKLILKKGNIRTHHFAHRSDSHCTDNWHYDMSEWHQRWQSKFPDGCQEIVKTRDGNKHRADVLIEDKKIVIEFQHSPLSSDEFQDRNEFYKSLGYTIVWVFDVRDQWNKDTIDNYSANKYKWNHPKATFNNFIPQADKDVVLYFQTQVDAKDDERLKELYDLISSSGIDDICGPEGDEYIKMHNDDKAELIKIVWAPERGFERFADDRKTYNEEDIVNMYYQKSKERMKSEIMLADLYDSPIELEHKDHTTYFFGCPKSTTHKCCWGTIDLPESQYNEIFPCNICEYRDEKSYEIKCKYRYKKLGIPQNTNVQILSRDNNGFINKIAYENEGKQIELNLQTYSTDSLNTLFELWNDDYCVAIFKNVSKKYFVKLCKNPKEQIFKYKKVYGCFSYDQYSFPKQSKEIYYCDRKEWICVWHKSN